MSDFAMTDIAGLMGVSSDTITTHSTSRKGSNELNMEDFLKLMIVQLTSQTIDDTMDTSEMMNQMVQMQMISAITNLTDASVMGYAASLVGQTVTIGYLEDGNLMEKEIQVMGTGTMNGQQVIFGSDGQTYGLNQIMAVGRLPDGDGKYPDPANPPASGTEGTGGTAGTQGGNAAESPGDDGEQGAAD